MTEYRVRWEIDVDVEAKSPDRSWDGEYIDLGGQP
jgi:hypothetical protein